MNTFFMLSIFSLASNTVSLPHNPNWYAGQAAYMAAAKAGHELPHNPNWYAGRAAYNASKKAGHENNR